VSRVVAQWAGLGCGAMSKCGALRVHVLTMRIGGVNNSLLRFGSVCVYAILSIKNDSMKAPGATVPRLASKKKLSKSKAEQHSHAKGPLPAFILFLKQIYRLWQPLKLFTKCCGLSLLRRHFFQ
jgi:hypothetical protein